METLKKNSLISEKNFPFECSNSYGVDEDFKVLHWHQEMEICYIKKGSGVYLINGIEYPFEQGDIIMISNDDIHLCYNDKDLIMQVVMFSPSFVQGLSINPLDAEYLSPFIESTKFSKKIDRMSIHTPILIDILNQIEQEYTSKQKGFELFIKSLLLKFLAIVIRYSSACNSEIKKNMSKKVSQKVRNIIEYIDDNYYEDINLHKLSHMFNISIPYLSSNFKIITGNSPIDYIIHKRIFMAKRFLKSSDKDILTISQDCGFKSLSNFNHLFKNFVGCTPREYRKS